MGEAARTIVDEAQRAHAVPTRGLERVSGIPRSS
jgi:hypothetical protein